MAWLFSHGEQQQAESVIASDEQDKDHEIADQQRDENDVHDDRVQMERLQQEKNKEKDEQEQEQEGFLGNLANKFMDGPKRIMQGINDYSQGIKERDQHMEKYSKGGWMDAPGHLGNASLATGAATVGIGNAIGGIAETAVKSVPIALAAGGAAYLAGKSAKYAYDKGKHIKKVIGHSKLYNAYKNRQANQSMMDIAKKYAEQQNYKAKLDDITSIMKRKAAVAANHGRQAAQKINKLKDRIYDERRRRGMYLAVHDKEHDTSKLKYAQNKDKILTQDQMLDL